MKGLDRISVHLGDSREVLKAQPDNSIDSGVTDPPYALVSIQKRFGKPGSAPAKDRDGLYARASSGFMGQQWDTGETAFDPGFWTEVLRVLKPGAYLLACGGTRTYHRLACAIEDAGFEIRDQIAWAYGSGFPKSHNQRFCDVARHKDLDGWGTAIKPAWEPIVMARKPMIGTMMENLLQYGTGALNIDGCRIHADDAQGGVYTIRRFAPGASVNADCNWKQEVEFKGEMKPGRWPANIVHDGSDDVLAAFPAELTSGAPTTIQRSSKEGYGNRSPTYGTESRPAGTPLVGYGDTGSAARFFYTAKADAGDRWGSKHPTVKPVDLMGYLSRLVTPPGGVVLDPFAGSGTTGVAALREGFGAILIEREPTFHADIQARLAHYAGRGGAFRRRNTAACFQSGQGPQQAASVRRRWHMMAQAGGGAVAE